MKKYILIAVLILGFLLRINQITNLPALNADEAAIGYNAYSLLKTGMDEHGNPWPIHFQSFNDYKPGLYFYIVLPFVGILGLTELAVRLPAVLIGTASILGIWLIARELLKDYKWAPEISALLLAISPWHIHFSRGGWEVNVAGTFIVFGIYFFLRGQKHTKFLVYAALFFVMGLYTYHAARVIIPLLGLILVVLYRKNIQKNFKKYASVALFTLVLLLPLGLDFLGPAGTSRASGVSIFADRGVIDRINEKRGNYSPQFSVLGPILHNKVSGFALSFGENYFEHFWGQFLFLSSDDIERNKVPEIGLFYLVSIPFFLYGVIQVNSLKRGALVLFGWILVAPIPAALTFQSPHALRSHGMVYPMTLLLGFALAHLISKLKRNHFRTVLIGGIFILFLWDFSRYLHQYYIHMAKTYPFSSQYGAKELAEYVSSRYNDFEKIQITDRYDQPYIMMLFYTKYPPELFQRESELTARDEYGFSTVRRFGKYEFASVKWNEVVDKRGVLVAGTDEEIPNDEANIIKSIPFPNGEPAYEIVPR